MAYNVKLEKFEGPLDLLLEIVERRKLNILDISLSSLAEQFLSYVRSFRKQNFEEIVEFLTIGSRLALLKSRELVPALNDELEEDGDIETLKQKLVLYHPYRSAAKLLHERDRTKRRFYGRTAFAGHPPVFHFPKKLSPQTLQQYVKSALSTVTSAKKIPQAKVKKTVSLEECIIHLQQIARGKKKVDFSTYLLEKKEDERVVHFVGMLELVRLGKISARQRQNFGTIVLTSHE